MSLTIEQKIQNDKYSGTISLIENEIVFSSQETELVRFNISEIRIIAEMTSDADPIKNDWHLVFVNNTTEYYIPAYANNMQDFLKELSGKLQFQIIMTLFASIELNSNILYPNELVGHKLLEFKEVEPVSIWEKIGKFLRLGKPMTSELTKEVLEYRKIGS